MDDHGEVEMSGSSWTIRTGVPGSPDPDGEPLASVHVLVRAWSRGGAEIRVSRDRTGGRSERQVLAFAIDELMAARDLLP